MKNSRSRSFLLVIAVVFSAQFLPVASCRLTMSSDYTFVSDEEILSNPWDFHLVVKMPSWKTPDDGVVLSHRFYDINDSDPVNRISPVDILVCTGIVARDVARFNFAFSWGDRGVNVSFITAGYTKDQVISSMDNVHCIARDNESLVAIESVQDGDRIVLSGYLVDVYGSDSVNAVTWLTDTVFGNTECEILVVSGTEPQVSTLAVLSFIFLICALVIPVVAVAVFVTCREKNACRIDVKKIIGNRQKRLP